MKIAKNLKKNANAMAQKYAPQSVNQNGDKIWFVYVNKAGSAVPAYYDVATRAFRSVVHGKQYNGVAIRNLVARPVVEGMLK